MKLPVKVCWIALILATFVSAGDALAARKVIVVTGIDEINTKRISTIRPVIEGIKEGLNKKNIALEFIYVELTEIDDSIKEPVGATAIARAMVHKPDLIITLTDDALKYVGAKISDVPVVFTWVVNNPTALGLPKENVTGFTRSSHATMIWSLARKLTGADTVSVLGKDNEAMQGAKEYLNSNNSELKWLSGVTLEEIYLVDNFSQWAKKVKECKSGMIYLADTDLIDRNGPMKSEDLVRWTVNNAKVPVIAASEKDVKAGALLAIDASAKDIGLSAAEIAVKILNGTKPSDIPYSTSVKGALVINEWTARKYGIRIPEEVLSMAAKVYDK